MPVHTRARARRGEIGGEMIARAAHRSQLPPIGLSPIVRLGCFPPPGDPGTVSVGGKKPDRVTGEAQLRSNRILCDVFAAEGGLGDR